MAEPRTSGFMFSYFNKSQYHDSCVPADKRAIAAEVSGKGPQKADGECDHVTKDTVWKQSVDAEKRCHKNWENDWGFLTDFDSKGDYKEQEELPDKAVVFSDNVPNTNSGNYGNRVGTELGQTMTRMEHNFYSSGRRRKMGDDMICY